MTISRQQSILEFTGQVKFLSNDLRRKAALGDNELQGAQTRSMASVAAGWVQSLALQRYDVMDTVFGVTGQGVAGSSVLLMVGCGGTPLTWLERRTSPFLGSGSGLGQHCELPGLTGTGRLQGGA